MMPANHDTVVNQPELGHRFDCQCTRCATGLEGINRRHTHNPETWMWAETALILVGGLAVAGLIVAATRIMEIIT